MEKLSEARIYVGTYAKYNEGSLFGKWMDVSDYLDNEEFYNACKDLHEDEEDPELMFQNWENIPEGLINESWLLPTIFEVIEAVSSLNDTEEEAFFAWLSYTRNNVVSQNIDDLIEQFEASYQGQFNSEIDYAMKIFDEWYPDFPDSARGYIDYDKFASDYFYNEGWYIDGFVFCR